MPRADPPGGIKELAKHNVTNKSSSRLSRIRKERGKKRTLMGSELVLTSMEREAAIRRLCGEVASICEAVRPDLSLSWSKPCNVA